MEIIISFIGLIFSFLFSGSETAYLTTNQLRLEIWIRQKLKSAVLAEKYFQNPDIFLSTTLVGNNLANVITTSFATVYLLNFWNETTTWIIITFIILFVAEIIPKVLFRTYANVLILKVVYFIRLFHFLLSPIIIFVTKLSAAVLRILSISDHNEDVIHDKQEILILVNEAKISGVVDEAEEKIISRVLTLPNRMVREAMVPRTGIFAIDERADISEVIQLMMRTGKTKIPVYKMSIDNITGVIFLFDLLGKQITIEEIIKPVMYVPENKKCNELLREFQRGNASIAVVIDEYGGTAGIVTLEDVVEELFGEFEESSVRSTDSIIKINKTTWKMQGTQTIEIINNHLNLEIPAGEYETIAGFVLSKLNKIPLSGEKIYLKDCVIIVTKADKKRIKEIRLIKRNP
jgi:CBS domain containing-hemolysin-like protein